MHRGVQLFELVFNRRLAKNWSMIASYRWSKLEGRCSRCGLRSSGRPSAGRLRMPGCG